MWQIPPSFAKRIVFESFLLRTSGCFAVQNITPRWCASVSMSIDRAFSGDQHTGVVGMILRELDYHKDGIKDIGSIIIIMILFLLAPFYGICSTVTP